MKYYLDPKEKPPFPKFDYQMDALRALGYDVYYLGIEKGIVYLCNNSRKQPLRGIAFYKIPGISRIAVYHSIYQTAADVFKEREDFDYAYIRSMPAMPSTVKAFRQIKKTNCRVIVEIPTHPPEKETGKSTSLLMRLFYKFTKGYNPKISEFVDLYTLIGEEASEFRGRPAVNIKNGISLSNIPLRTPGYGDGEIHLLGLATMAIWHGYDRVIEGLREYRERGGQEKVVFHLIGSDGDGSLKKWRTLVKVYGLEDNVVFEGSQYGGNLSPYFNQCHLAVGSLALHRISFTSAATLKTREYMARGIPFLQSARDQAVIDPDSGFYIKIPADDSPVDIGEIIRFARDKVKDEGIGERMRQYARENMTWDRQFLKVFEWFSEHYNR